MHRLFAGSKSAIFELLAQKKTIISRTDRIF